MTTITKTETGYILNENGTETIVTDITKDGKSVILPENESGRKYIALSKFKDHDTLELTAINRTFSGEPRQTGKKNPRIEDLKEYMTKDEFFTVVDIMTRAEAAYKEAHEKKPLTEKEKLQKKLEALQKKLAALEGDN